MSHPPLPQFLFLRQLLAHRAGAQAGADEGAGEQPLRGGHIDAGKALQRHRAINEHLI